MNSILSKIENWKSNIKKSFTKNKIKYIQNMGWWWLHVGSKPLIMVATCNNPHITQWGLQCNTF
jgi:hypothetical protein